MSWFSRQAQPVADKRAINAWERTYEQLYPSVSQLQREFPLILRSSFPKFREYLKGRDQNATGAAQLSSTRENVNTAVVGRMNDGLDQLSLRVIKLFGEVERAWKVIDEGIKKDTVYAYMDNVKQLQDKMRLILSLKYRAFALIEGGMWADAEFRKEFTYTQMQNFFLAHPGYRNKILKVSDNAWIDGLETEWQVIMSAVQTQTGEALTVLNTNRRR